MRSISARRRSRRATRAGCCCRSRADPGKTVRQVVEEAVQPIVDLLRRYDEINERFATVDPDAMDALLEEQARVQEEIDKHDAWTLDRRLEQAMDVLRCPPGDTPVACFPAASGAVWPFAACC